MNYYKTETSDHIKYCGRCTTEEALFYCKQCVGYHYYCLNCNILIHSKDQFKSHLIESISTIKHKLGLNSMSQEDKCLDSNESLADRLKRHKERLNKKKIVSTVDHKQEIKSIYKKQIEQIEYDGSKLKQNLNTINNELIISIEEIQQNLNKLYSDENKGWKAIEIDLEQRLVDLANKFSVNEEKMKKQIQALTSELNELRNVSKDNLEEITALKATNSDLAFKLSQHNKKKENEVLGVANEYSSRIDLIFEEVEKERRAWREDLMNINIQKENEVSLLKEELEVKQNKISELIEIINSYSQSKEFLSSKESTLKLKEDNTLLAKRLSALLEEKKSANAKINELLNENIVLKENISNLKMNASAYEEEISTLSKRLNIRNKSKPRFKNVVLSSSTFC